MNRWCELVGLRKPPLVEDVATQGACLFHLAFVALLEHGEPMTWEQLAERLAASGVRSWWKSDLTDSLKKAWHGLRPLVKTPDGRVAVEAASPDARELAFELGLLPHHALVGQGLLFVEADRAPTLPPAPAAHAAPEAEPTASPDDLPLTVEELRAAWTSSRTVGRVRWLAGLLDAAGRALPPRELWRLQEDVGMPHWTVTEAEVRRWRSSLLRRAPDGTLHLDRASPELVPARRALRRAAAVVARHARARERQATARSRRLDAVRQLDEAAASRASSLRRALLRPLPGPDAPRALGVLDLADGSLRTFGPDELPAALEHLGRFDVLAGLDVRPTLLALGQEPDRWRRVELRPSTDEGGRSTTRLIEPGPLLAATLDGARGQSKASEAARLIESGDLGRVRELLAADLRALYVFFEFGRSHGFVLRPLAGGVQRVPVEWRVPGDELLTALLDRARRARLPVELVLEPPSPEQPFATARQAEILQATDLDLVLRLDGRVTRLWLETVFTARLLPGATAATVAPPPPVGAWLEVRAQLRSVAAPVWRRLRVPAHETLGKLHRVLLAAFGWDDSRFHRFVDGDLAWAPGAAAREARHPELAAALDEDVEAIGPVVPVVGATLAYEYGLPDGWCVDVTVERVLEPDEHLTGRLECTGGERASPPESCRNAAGWAELRAILADPRHPGRQAALTLVGPGFAPGHFDRLQVNQVLGRVDEAD